MADIIVSTADTTARTLQGDDTLTVTDTGSIIRAGAVVTWNMAVAQAGVGVVVSNDGTITATSGRAFDTTGTAAAKTSFELDNTGSITAASDVMRIQKSLIGGDFTIDNSGSMTANAGRGFNLQEFSQLHSFTYTGEEGSALQSTDDALRLTTGTAATFTGTLHVDNSGTIQTLGGGQALDFNDVAATAIGQIVIDNRATGLLEGTDADAVRPGAFATVNNYGTIQSVDSAPTTDGNDGIDVQANGGVVINNFQDAQVIGTRHGVTGDKAVTVVNDGSITGQLGSGINLDTLSTDPTSSITNQAHGTIEGNADGANDGDAVDIDGLADIDNFGTIRALGTWDGGLSEAISIGGGSIHNEAGGLITSVQRAITVDDSNLGNAFAAVTITNEGTITGTSGEAISITDTFADTLTNKGQINGSVAMGGGDDVINLYEGSASGSIDGGDGSDTIHLFAAGSPTGPTDLAAAANVEALDVASGAWSIGAAASFSDGVDIASGASLTVGSGSTAGSLSGDVSNAGALVFDRSDASSYAGAISGHGSVSVQGGGKLTLSGHSTFDGGVDIVSGSLELASADAAGTGAISFETGTQTLALQSGAFTAGDFASEIDGLGLGDSIDLEGVDATAVVLGAGNVLTVATGSGALTLHLDAGQDFTAQRFALSSDGAGGTLLTLAIDHAPVIDGGGQIDHPVVEAGVGEGVHLATASAITFSDPDAGDTPVFDTTGWTHEGTGSLYTLAGQYGEATLDTSTGVVTYRLDNSDPDTQALDTGDTVVDGFVVKVIDGHGLSVTQNLIFTVQGQNDAVTGTADADQLTGTAFADELKGAAGDDILIGRQGDDTLKGGAGSDTASFAGSNARITADLGAGVASGEGTDVLVSIENLIGSAKADRLAGDLRANLLDGGAGDDVLAGGGGADTLTGGDGDDRFVFAALTDSKAKAPVLITDLGDGDRIDLSDIDARTDKAGDQKFKLVDAFDGHAGQLVLSYDAGHDRTVLSVDVDGDAKADMTVWISGDHSGFSGFAL